MEDKELKRKVLAAYQQGMGRYVLLNGVLRWGLGTGTIYRVLRIFAEKGFSMANLFSGIFHPQTLLTLFVFSLGGVVWGMFVWFWIQREAKKLEAGKKKPKS